jgi:ParB-like chromosome segregation protein Spo0J
MKINISDFKINHGKRVANPHKVKQLAESILRLGLLQPIVVTKDNVLISGLQRIEAYKLLGYDKIEIKDFDEIKKELAEIDENLCRAELSVWEQGSICYNEINFCQIWG